MTISTASLTLARRLERAEATANAAFVEARARVAPSVGAAWIEVAGAYAMFDGPHSPLTQTFGAGLFDRFEAPEFAAAEAFFDSRGAATHHEICSLASEATTRLLHNRGYTAIERSTVLIRDTRPSQVPRDSGITVRRVAPDEIAQWARVSALGWSSAGPEVSAFVEQLGSIMGQARGTHCFLAEEHSQPIAAAALNISDVALLAGASTIPSARGRGAQRALLEARLAFAAGQGTDLAMIVTEPESASQRNAERAGFRPAYGRTKWQRPARLTADA